MGIDVEILIRKVPAELVTDEWLKQKSWELVKAFEPKHFFISDGLPLAEYEVKNKEWHAAFNAHPGYPAWKASDNADKAIHEHERILADIGKPPEMLRLAIRRTNELYRDDDEPFPPGGAYYQDGDTIVAEPGECLIQLSLFGRYYGVDYERGDVRLYVGMVEWLEQNIPGCEVWYGGDSSGCEAEPFTPIMRVKTYSQEDHYGITIRFIGPTGEIYHFAAHGIVPGEVLYRSSRVITGVAHAS